MAACKVPKCFRHASRRTGLCSTHAARLERFGDVLADVPVGAMNAGGRPIEIVDWCHCDGSREPGPGWWWIGCDRCGRLIHPDQRVDPTKKIRRKR
jgi:hypothetical protein